MKIKELLNESRPGSSALAIPLRNPNSKNMSDKERLELAIKNMESKIQRFETKAKNKRSTGEWHKAVHAGNAEFEARMLRKSLETMKQELEKYED